nr:hypothetical protein [[Leptolyngbya] sp. PCC 7376]
MTSVINSADSQGRYISSDTLKSLAKYLEENTRLTAIAEKIARKHDQILKQTISNFWDTSEFEKVSSGQYTACLRDLDFFLRYSTYTMIAGDYSILDKRVLNGLAETYTSLDIPISRVLEALQSMKRVLIELIDEDNLEIVTDCLDYLINGLNKDTQLLSSNNASWEPQSYHEWLKMDRLAQYILKNYPNSLIEEEAKVFFESLQLMPYPLRKKVWWEREVMTTLYEKMSNFEDKPGFVSIAVGEKEIDKKQVLVGKVVFTTFLPEKEIKSKFSIPDYIQVESSINALSKFPSKVPIVIELANRPIPLNFKTPLEIKDDMKQSTSVVKIQSGDAIVGKSSVGTFGKKVTLSTFLAEKKIIDSCDSKFQENIYALTVGHGFEVNTQSIHSHRDTFTSPQIGTIFSKESHSYQEKIKNLDISLIKLDESLKSKIDLNLKWVDQIPKKIVPIFANMPVQMFGATSKHQVGYVRNSGVLTAGYNPSIIPSFSVDIEAAPGDSGALLVGGHHDQYPIPKHLEEHYSREWRESVTCSACGILISSSNIIGHPKEVLFRPMLSIVSALKMSIPK